MTDSELQNLLKSSPQAGHRAVIEEYTGYVYAIVYNKLRSCGTNEDVDECVSDVFASFLMKYKPDSGYEGDLRGYIGTIAKRTAISRYRSLSTKFGRSVSIEEESVGELRDTADIEESAEKADTQRLLIDAVENLGEPDSTIILQSFFYNRTAKQIAEMVSMTTAAVLMRKGRALKRLKDILSRSGITL
ncbi:MAG TPA: sigma-70 family RNA polymerase sigma factor [Ruminococcus flavefaciens]|nr:sigma-70 family RNA polymerase sigma factor [Ruminococcus flavefaciens]